MAIRYACCNCRDILNVSGYRAVNEVGRKYCDGCGLNHGDLECIDRDKFDKAVAENKENGN